MDRELKDALKNLRELEQMLKEEAKRWYSTDNSKTAETIASYQVGVFILIELVDSDNKSALLQVFQRRHLTAKGLGKCFHRGNHIERREYAQHLFASAVRVINTKL